MGYPENRDAPGLSTSASIQITATHIPCGRKKVHPSNLQPLSIKRLRHREGCSSCRLQHGRSQEQRCTSSIPSPPTCDLVIAHKLVSRRQQLTDRFPSQCLLNAPARIQSEMYSRLAEE